MQIDDATRQATAPDTEGGDRMSPMTAPGAEVGTAADGQTKAEGLRQMDAVVERNNLWQAYERVMRNKGAAGADGLSVSEFKVWLQQHWPSVRAALLARLIAFARTFSHVRRCFESLVILPLLSLQYQQRSVLQYTVHAYCPLPLSCHLRTKHP
jgi:hypothetical protein